MVPGIPPRNPLNPQYTLPAEPPIVYETPKFLRDTLSTADIPGSRPTNPYSHIPTNHRQLDVTDIEGTMSRPRCFERTRGINPNSLDVSDVSTHEFRTTRTTNALDPRYVFATTPAQALQSFNRQLNTKTGETKPMQWQVEAQYGEIEGSYPRRAHAVRDEKNQMSLRTQDIPGSTVGWARLNHPYPRSTWHKVPKPTADIQGAQPRVGPEIKTKRHLHPCDPQYELINWIGAGTELKNPFDKDPKMEKFKAIYAAKDAAENKVRQEEKMRNSQPKVENKVEFFVPQPEPIAPQSTLAAAPKSIQATLSESRPAPAVQTQPRSEPKSEPQMRVSSAPTTREAPSAADAAAYKAYELRQKAMELDSKVKDLKINRFMSKTQAPNYRYPTTSLAEDLSSTSPLLDIAPTGKNYQKQRSSALGFDYNNNSHVGDATSVLQQFTLTPTGRIVPKPAKSSKTLANNGTRALSQPPIARTPGTLKESKPIAYWSGKGIGDSGPSSSLQYNGVAFKNFASRENFTRRQNDIADVRTLAIQK